MGSVGTVGKGGWIGIGKVGMVGRGGVTTAGVSNRRRAPWHMLLLKNTSIVRKKNVVFEVMLDQVSVDDYAETYG